MKYKVDINLIKYIQSYFDIINSLEMNEIEWYDGEDKLDISSRLIEEWKYIGLSNIQFVLTEFYNGFGSDVQSYYQDNKKL